MEMETRLARIEIEERADNTPKFRGYAALFETPTDIGGMFVEKIARGAFTDALNRSDVHALYNHNDNWVLGRNKSGTLTMREDEKGLYVEIDPPNTQQARDIMELVKRGDVDQMSFAFTMQGGAESWNDTSDGLPIRTITRVGELFDVTITPRGAYPQTNVAVRSLEEFRNKNKAQEQAQKNFNAAALRIRMKKDLASRTLQENGKGDAPKPISNNRQGD